MISLIIVSIALTLAGYTPTSFSNETMAIMFTICIVSDLQILSRAITK